jgi:hypothetical protein
MTTLMLAVLGPLAVAAAGYAGLIAWHRSRYDTVHHVAEPETYELLDCFIPSPEVLEHHQTVVDAPADAVFDAAKRMQLMESPMVRAIIKARELALGGVPDPRSHPGPLVAQMQSIGWVVLAEKPGSEIVLGAATVPWEANPVFCPIQPMLFEAFREPGYVKIAWSLRVEPIDATRTRFHTETRVATTDAATKARFRRYWSYVAPGVELIRVAMLQSLKRQLEPRGHSAAA